MYKLLYLDVLIAFPDQAEVPDLRNLENNIAYFSNNPNRYLRTKQKKFKKISKKLGGIGYRAGVHLRIPCCRPRKLYLS